MAVNVDGEIFSKRIRDRKIVGVPLGVGDYEFDSRGNRGLASMCAREDYEQETLRERVHGVLTVELSGAHADV